MQRVALQRLIIAAIGVVLVIMLVSNTFFSGAKENSGKSKTLLSDSKKCPKTHTWRLQNITFPKDVTNSQVKLVAFLAASCGFCITQSASLATLRDELTRDNYSKISFLIVNTFQSSSNNRLDAFRSVTSIDVYQDTEMEKVWESYNASKDDMLIFDSCDRLVYHLKLPETVITSGKVKELLIKAYNQNLCEEKCQKSSKS